MQCVGLHYIDVRALAGLYITIHFVVKNTTRVAAAVLTANQRIEAERLRETYVTVGTSDARWTHASTSCGIAETARTVTFCYVAEAKGKR